MWAAKNMADGPRRVFVALCPTPEITPKQSQDQNTLLSFSRPVVELESSLCSPVGRTPK